MKIHAYSAKLDLSTRTHQLNGHFSASGGSGNDIIAYVLSEDDFVNLKNGHEANKLYDSGKVTQAAINASLTNGGGSCYLVFDNQFSALTPKAVMYNATLTYMQ